MTKTYRSKIDIWLLVVLSAAMAVGLIGSLTVLAVGGREVWWAVLPLTLGVGFPAWILTATFYRLSDDELLVRSGPFSWQISTSEIRRVTPTHSPLSSPALSLDRLLIEYGDGRKIMISPNRQDQFIADLQRVAAFDLG